MIGSFDSLTISRLGESSGAAAEAVLGEDGAGAATGGWLACSVGFSFEHPARIVPAEATSAAYPNSLRLSLAEAGLLLGAGAQVPHPVVLHVPHPLAEALITLSESPIAFSPFEWLLLATLRTTARAADAALLHMADDTRPASPLPTVNISETAFAWELSVLPDISLEMTKGMLFCRTSSKDCQFC
jgi:hypothetical protein